MNVEEGLNILKYSKKHPAKVVEKTLFLRIRILISKLDTGKIR